MLPSGDSPRPRAAGQTTARSQFINTGTVRKANVRILELNQTACNVIAAWGWPHHGRMLSLGKPIDLATKWFPQRALERS